TLPGVWAATAYRGRTVGAESSGFARREDSEVSATLKQRIAFGSTTKALTGVLAGVLVQKGRLKYSTTLDAAVPKLVVNFDSVTKNLTVEQLITHRAGLGGGP